MLIHCFIINLDFPDVCVITRNPWLASVLSFDLFFCLSLNLLGCPVNGHPTPNITWFFDGHPFHLPYQVLASGQILQILNVSNDYQGEISCRAQNEAGLLIQKTSLVIQGKT